LFIELKGSVRIEGALSARFNKDEISLRKVALDEKYLSEK
jgi:hypothetical protein